MLMVMVVVSSVIIIIIIINNIIKLLTDCKSSSFFLSLPPSISCFISLYLLSIHYTLYIYIYIHTCACACMYIILSVISIKPIHNNHNNGFDITLQIYLIVTHIINYYYYYTCVFIITITN